MKSRGQNQAERDEVWSVIELDGDQNLADREADRNDRKKDLLLQENGYLVLRFLAADLGGNLDRVLDVIERVLVGR